MDSKNVIQNISFTGLASKVLINFYHLKSVVLNHDLSLGADYHNQSVAMWDLIGHT